MRPSPFFPLRPGRRAVLLLLSSAAVAPGLATAADATPDAAVHATQVPRSFTVLYQMQRGRISGSSELGWKRTADGYEAHMTGKVAGFAVLDWASSGGFDAAGVAPRRYVEHRIGKGDRDAVFNRAEGRIGFSGKTDEVALVPGAQDRLSWMIQLPAILAADPAKAKAGTRITLFVVGTRGHAENWIFESLGNDTIRTPAGTLKAVRWARKVGADDETQAEVWLDPTRHFLPVRLRLPLPPLDEPIEFNLAETNP